MGILDFLNDLTARLFDRDDLHELSTHSHEDPVAPASVPHMPAEIVVAILEAVQASGSSAKDNKHALASCALVCRDWSVVAQKILFRRVDLHSAPALEGFMTAVSRSTPRGRMLADTVEAMRCVIDAKQPRGISQLAFAHAVLQCPRLSDLSLAVYGDISGAAVSHSGAQRCTKPSTLLFDNDVLSLLQTGPSIAALRFDNWSDNAYALSQLLAAFPSITSLSIRGTTPVVCAPTSPSPCALTRLHMDLRTPPSAEFVQWLLRSPASNLRVLDFKRSPPPQLLEDLLVEHCGTLESLRLPSCASLECAAALACCTRLRELHLEDLWAASNVQRLLPPTLEHLAFTVDKHTAMDPILDAVKNNALLRTVSMHIRATGACHPQLPNLKMACAFQGVEYHAHSTIQEFRASPQGRSVI